MFLSRDTPCSVLFNYLAKSEFPESNGNILRPFATNTGQMFVLLSHLGLMLLCL